MFRPNKKEKIILASLGVLILIVWVPALFSGSKGGPTRQKQQQARSPSAPSQPVAQAEGPTDLPGWGENPFTADRGNSVTGPTPVVLKGGSTSYFLSGILWDPQAPSAIINNQVLSVGDRVGGWQVKEIQRDKVILSDGDSTQTLRVE